MPTVNIGQLVQAIVSTAPGIETLEAGGQRDCQAVRERGRLGISFCSPAEASLLLR